MYLKILMSKDKFQILEQNTRARMRKTSSNGIRIEILNTPELRGYERKLFLRGDDEDSDIRYLSYDSGKENFTNYLRALEEVVESFVVCLR